MERGQEDRLEGRLEDRLIDLEVRYTHLERQLDEVNQVVIEQQKVIEGLVRRVSELKGVVRELGDPQANEKPPHY